MIGDDESSEILWSIKIGSIGCGIIGAIGREAACKGNLSSKGKIYGISLGYGK